MQQAYNELHLYEMRLIAYLRKGGQALKNYHERLQDLRAQTELDNEERVVQAAELAKKIQWLQDERFALEKELLKFTETKQELKFSASVESDTTKGNPWLGRIRSWLPA